METGPSVAQTDNGRELKIKLSHLHVSSYEAKYWVFQVTYSLLQINNKKNQHVLKKYPMLEATKLKS